MMMMMMISTDSRMRITNAIWTSDPSRERWRRTGVKRQGMIERINKWCVCCPLGGRQWAEQRSWWQTVSVKMELLSRKIKASARTVTKCLELEDSGAETWNSKLRLVPELTHPLSLSRLSPSLWSHKPATPNLACRDPCLAWELAAESFWPRHSQLNRRYRFH